MMNPLAKAVDRVRESVRGDAGVDPAPGATVVRDARDLLGPFKDADGREPIDRNELDVRGVTLDRVTLGPFAAFERCHFQDMTLRNCVLYGVSMRASRFSRCTFEGCLFAGCSFLSTRLVDVLITGSRFFYGDLRQLQLLDSVVTGSEIAMLALNDSTFARTRVNRSTFLQCDQQHMVIEHCKFNECRLIRSWLDDALVRQTRFADCEFYDGVLPRQDSFGPEDTPGARFAYGAGFGAPA